LNFGRLSNSDDSLVKTVVAALDLLVELLIQLEHLGDEKDVAVVCGHKHKLMLGTK
jgi:hypothetical protein